MLPLADPKIYNEETRGKSELRALNSCLKIGGEVQAKGRAQRKMEEVESEEGAR